MSPPSSEYQNGASVRSSASPGLVPVADLPEPLRVQAAGLEVIYAVHRPDGERLALVRDRALAFALARQNDLAPVNAH